MALISKYSFKETLECLFLNIRYLIFLIIISTGIVAVLWVAYNQNLRFALNEKLFEVTDVFKTDSVSLLTQRFTCSTSSDTWSWCGFDAVLLILLFLFIEGFALWVIIKRRKTIAKRFLIAYVLIQQIYPVLLFVLYLYVPDAVVSNLSKQADQEIVKSVSVLASAEKRTNLGIINTINDIGKALEKTAEIPTFFEHEPEVEAILQLQKITHTDKDTLYRSVIIPSILYDATKSASLKEQIQFDVLLFPTNTLIIKSANQSVVKQLTPILAKKLLSINYASYIKRPKKSPNVSVLENEQYLVVLQKKQEELKRDHQNGMQEVSNGLQNIENTISQLQSALVAADVEYSRYETYGQNWLNECESALSPTDSFCLEGKQTIEKSLQESRVGKSQIETRLKEYVEVKPKWLLALNQRRKAYEDFLRDPVTPEYQAGAFVSPDNIYIKYDPIESSSFSEYLQTLVHEYLHYENNNATDKFPKFLEEGVTDYLASNLVKEFLQTQSLDSGYPELVEVITLLLDKLSKDNVFQAYFTRQESTIKSLVDKRYGKGVYNQLKTKSDQIYYMSTMDSVTKTDILKEITALLQ